MDGREKFEDQFAREWQDAFDGMQETPPPGVWSEIDRQLTYEELAMYKNRVVYYKWSAAAVVLLAVFSGLFLVFSGDEFVTNHYVSQRIEVDAPVDRSTPPGFSINEADQQATGAGAMAFVSEEEAEEQVKDESKHPIEQLVVAGEAGNDEVDLPVFDETLYHEFTLERIEPNLMVAANYEDKEIFKIPTYSYTGKKKNAKREKYWAGIDVGRSTFDPNFSSGGNALASGSDRMMAFSQANTEASDRIAPNVRESMAAGETVTMGVNFGFKVADRWTLQSGFQYLRSDATTTTNVVIETTSIREVIPASSEVKNVPQVQRALKEETVIEYDYRDVDMANQFQFATIPLKAGYRLMDSKFSVELNAGVAANIYLGNKLTAPDAQLASVTFGPGDTSPYRELSFSGLAGVQIGYEFFDNFDLTVEPNYRQSINSLTKDSSPFTSSPFGFGVMTGIRYRFN